MRSRPIAYCLAVVLLLAACNRSKNAPPSAENSSNSSPTAAAPAEPQAAPPAAPTTTPEPAPETAPEPARKAASAPPPEPPPPPKPKPIVIPAGTVLTVRLDQAVGSKSSKEGERFEASLAEPVVVGGKAIVPSGTKASGTVTEAHPAGRFKGGATLALALNSLVIHGNVYKVQATAVSQESKGKGKRTATMVGGGAAGGALIGGLAGGGKGAAIGALVGGGAGTAGAGLTGNHDITLPAESALSFKMTAPITLSGGGTEESAPAETAAPPPQQ